MEFFIGLVFSILLCLLLFFNSNYYRRLKGKRYERKVSQYYRSKGYNVIEYGLEKGFNDEGIDVIAKKDNEILLIQCKNWKGSKRIGEPMIQQFYGSTCFFTKRYYEKEMQAGIKIMSLYAVPSKKIFRYRALRLFKLHYLYCKYVII